MNEQMYLPASAAAKEEDSLARPGSPVPISREIIGERVRRARIAANLTQQQLAGDTYSKGYISAVERGKMTPSFQALRLLAERLNRPLSFFLGEGEVGLEALGQSSTAAYVLPDEKYQQREQEAWQVLIEAEACLRKDQADKALVVLQVETNGPPAALPLAERPRWYWLAGWAGVWGHRQSEAIGWLERGLEVVEAARTQTLHAQRVRLGEMAERIRYFLGVCYYDLAQPVKAREHHLRCLAAITDGVVADPELTFLIYKALGNDNSVLGRYEDAILFLQRACRLADDLNEPRQRGLTYWGLGQTYKSSGDLFRARSAFVETVNTFERLDNMELASRAHAMLGLVLVELKEYQEAESHLRLALKAAERIGNVYARGIALGNLAILHLEQGRLDEAIAAAQEGIRALHQSGSYRTEGQVYQTLAEACEARGDVAAAEQAYKESIATLARTEDRKFMSRARERYGQFLAAQGRFAEAFEQMAH